MLLRLVAVVLLPACLAVAFARLATTPLGAGVLLAALGCWLSFASLSSRSLASFLDRQPKGPAVAPEPAVRFLARLLAFHLPALAILVTAFGELSALGMAAALAAVHAAGAAVLPQGRPFHRGRRLLTLRQARRRARRQRRGPGEALPWGGVLLPPSAAKAHFTVVGATGSGKSLTLRLLMQSVLPALTPGSGRRALIYDAKQDLLGLLAGMGIRCPVRVLHPLDTRSVAWNVACDCTSPLVALQIATAFFPVEAGPNRFFTDAARDLFVEALLALAEACPGRWTLRDLVLAMREPGRLRELLSMSQAARDRLHYFDEPRTFQNVYATLRAQLAWYEPVAAAWGRAESTVSLEGWLREESVLVLPSDEGARAPLEVINRVLFQRFCELALAGPETDETTTWVFLDEAREAGRLEGLGRLLTKGRSKGVAVVLGFQDVEGLRSVYGDKEANELVGQCGNKAILRLESPETARWASDLFGEHEAQERSRSETVGLVSPPTATSTDQVARRPAVLPSQFLDLPRCGPAVGLRGFYLSPWAGAYAGSTPWRRLMRQLLPPDPGTDNVRPRPPADQRLEPWGEEDLSRVGLAAARPAAPDEPAAGSPARPRLQVVPAREWGPA